jgi:hypothetical protein
MSGPRPFLLLLMLACVIGIGRNVLARRRPSSVSAA